MPSAVNTLQALSWLGQSVESWTVEPKVTDSIPGKGVKQHGRILSDAHYFFYKIFSLTVYNRHLSLIVLFSQCRSRSILTGIFPLSFFT